MGSFIRPDNSYYEGQQASQLDAPVPQRPSPFSTWNGTAWVTPDAATIQDTIAQSRIDSTDALQFDILFQHENALRAIRAAVNVIAPNTFTAAQASQVTRAQFRQALVDRWKQLNP